MSEETGLAFVHCNDLEREKEQTLKKVSKDVKGLNIKTPSYSTGRNLIRETAIKREDNILTTHELFPH